METLLIEYGVKSEIISKILQAFSKIIGAKVKQVYVPTEEEQEAINRALNSGTGSIDELKELLRK